MTYRLGLFDLATPDVPVELLDGPDFTDSFRDRCMLTLAVEDFDRVAANGGFRLGIFDASLRLTEFA